MIPTRSLFHVGVIFIIQLSFFVWSLCDSHKCVRLTNDPVFESSRKAKKDPWLAVFLTLLIPGLGHLYLRRWFVGAALIICCVFMPDWITKEFPHIDALFLIINALFLTIVCLHVRFISRCYRGIQKKAVFVIPMLAVAARLMLFASVLLFIVHVAQAYSVPTFSMSPTLVPGDRVLVNKLTDTSLQRGDLVVFKSLNDLSVNYIKRVAALENETVEMREGNIYINGKQADFASVQDLQIKHSKQIYAGDGKPFKVPFGHVFLIGDNINNSYDSRFFGPVPCENIIGKAYKIYWPLDRTGLL